MGGGKWTERVTSVIISFPEVEIWWILGIAGVLRIEVISIHSAHSHVARVLILQRECQPIEDMGNKVDDARTAITTIFKKSNYLKEKSRVFMEVLQWNLNSEIEEYIYYL